MRILNLYFILVCMLLFISLPGYSQNRVERPVQLQANFAGGFLSIAGNALADETVDDFKVDHWVPGISVGYHLNGYLYFGYSLYPSMELTLKEDWGLSPAALDGRIVLDHKTGYDHNLEARISPFNFGLYLSLAVIRINNIKYKMKFRRKSETMLIGDNAYATDMDVT